MSALSDLSQGSELAGYRLERRLGSGAMSEVWLARQTGSMGFSKDVALKVTRLDSEELNQQHIEAMINEGRACSRVRHSNVVDIYDLGQEGPWTYMAMEFVSGFTFRHLIDRSRSRGTRLPDSVIIDLAIGATRGLHAAHKAVDEEGQALGLVHRDIKPSNLMLDQWGAVKVVDFGIARASTNVRETVAGVTKGTPAYMAPEQWRGWAVGPPADIFSLGVVLWELVSCRVLFEGKAVMQVYQRLRDSSVDENVAPISQDFPMLVPVLARMLARSPDDRYQTGSELLRDLLELRRKIPASGDLAAFAGLLATDGIPTDPTESLSHPSVGAMLAPVDESWRSFLAAFEVGGDTDEVPVLADAPALSVITSAKRPTISTSECPSIPSAGLVEGDTSAHAPTRALSSVPEPPVAHPTLPDVEEPADEIVSAGAPSAAHAGRGPSTGRSLEERPNRSEAASSKGPPLLVWGLLAAAAALCLLLLAVL